MGPVPGREPEDHRYARRSSTTRRTRTTSPTPWRTRPSSGCTASAARTPHKPFFVYFSTGCSHAPHHVAKEWADRYKGQFDQGWDRLREETFARQKELGVVPPDAELTPRDEAFPAWDDVPDKLKPFYARQMEVYAGYSENADHNVGRVIDAIEELGELDNTLIIWIWGDNGASMEGTVTGSFNELTMQNGIPLTDEMQLQLSERYGGVDAWSTSLMAPHYGAAWAWAGNTPFKWGKQVGSHLGGTRNPMVLHWPDRITDAGGLRSQFTHVIDIAPLILDVTGIPEPRTVDGIEQEPMHGTSFAASLTDARRAGAPHPAVLRDHRQPGDVQGRLVAGDEDRAHPVGDHSGGAQALRARTCGTRTPARPSCTTCRTTSPRPRTCPPSTRTRCASSRSCSGRRPSGTRCSRCSRRCPPSSGCCRRCRSRRRSSSGATCRT